MKIYVVTARYCEDLVVLGATNDYRTAERIYDCEEHQDIKPDWVSIDEYNTDDYIPLTVGLNPYDVLFFDDVNYGVEVKIASLDGFVQNSVFRTMRNGEECLLCNVYARDKEHALKAATILKEKHNL